MSPFSICFLTNPSSENGGAADSLEGSTPRHFRAPFPVTKGGCTLWTNNQPLRDERIDTFGDVSSWIYGKRIRQFSEFHLNGRNRLSFTIWSYWWNQVFEAHFGLPMDDQTFRNIIQWVSQWKSIVKHHYLEKNNHQLKPSNPKEL